MKISFSMTSAANRVLAQMRWLAPVGLAFFLVGCNQEWLTPQSEISVSGSTMGTYYSVKVVGSDLPEEAALQSAVQATLDEVDNRMSTYKPDSELSHFNQHQSLRPFNVSTELAKVVTEAIHIGRDTAGALDVTVGPLVNLWGFGPDKRSSKIPEPFKIAEVRSRTGLDKLSVQVSMTGDAIQKAHPELYLDLSAIAKGYAVDRVAEMLKSKGISNYLVEVGGELRVQGRNGKGSLWRVAVESPKETLGSSIQQVIQVGENGVATSGDYRNYYEENGQRFSHTIDPATGAPITHNLASITVIHPSCMIADGFATALNVMGADKAMAYAETHQLPIYLIVKGENGFEVKMSSSFRPYLAK